MNLLLPTGLVLLLGQASEAGSTEASNQLGISYPELVAQLIGFSILLFVLHKFAYKPVLDVLEARRQKVKQSMEDADKIKHQLEEAETERKRIIAEAHEKAARTLADAQKAAEIQTQQKIQETVGQVESMIQKAQEAMKLERERLITEVRREMARLIVATSGKVLGRTLAPEDQERLQKEAVNSLAN